MRYIRYSTMDIKEVEPNVCYLGGMCRQKQRRECEKEKECLQRLCGNERRKIGKVSIFKSWEYGDKTSRKIERAVEKWRKAMFKICRPIEFIIQRPR